MRTQKNGKQKGWTFEDLKKGFEQFYKINKRYPTAQEIDEFEFLPSSRSIQRRFGGLVELRKSLELRGSDDFRTGTYSSRRAKKIAGRARRLEKEIYDYLTSIFGVESVQREYFFTDDKRTRTDFFIYSKNGNFAVDVLYPDNKRNLIGCLNSKMRTYSSETMLQYPIIFLQMNDNILQDEIQCILDKKKNKLLKYQNLMNLEEFKKLCSKKNSLKLKNRQTKS